MSLSLDALSTLACGCDASALTECSLFSTSSTLVCMLANIITVTEWEMRIVGYVC